MTGKLLAVICFWEVQTQKAAGLKVSWGKERVWEAKRFVLVSGVTCVFQFRQGMVPCTSISLILHHVAILDGIWFAFQWGSQAEMRNLMWAGRAAHMLCLSLPLQRGGAARQERSSASQLDQIHTTDNTRPGSVTRASASSVLRNFPENRWLCWLQTIHYIKIKDYAAMK